MPELTIKYPNALLNVERHEISEVRTEAVLTIARAQDPLNGTYSALGDLLENEGHDDDCVWRCLRNECSLDHHCSQCDDEEKEG